jgi:hypothetical protein
VGAVIEGNCQEQNKTNISDDFSVLPIATTMLQHCRCWNFMKHPNGLKDKFGELFIL